MVCDWFQVQVLCFCPSDWFLMVPKIPLQNSLSRNQWLSKWVCTYFLFELCLWELFLIEEIGSKDWVFRVVFEKIQINFLVCFVWFFVLFHVLTINALGCHINFKLFFFPVYEYWYREKINYFYPKSKHKTVRLFYFMFQTIWLFKHSLLSPSFLNLPSSNLNLFPLFNPTLFSLCNSALMVMNTLLHLK